MDSHGALFGATYGAIEENHQHFEATVYVLRPPATPGGEWTIAVLHRFPLGQGEIYGGLALGSDGAVFGTTPIGGVKSRGCAFNSCGTVFQAIP